MKNDLFEILMSLFERSLNELHKNQKSINLENDPLDLLNEEEIISSDSHTLYLKSAQRQSIRIVTYDEQMKLTKASYQFIMRMKLLNIIDAKVFESIMHQLSSSDSRIVTLQETKWTIRDILATHLKEQQLAFLDLVLYQKEDELTVQ